MVFVFLLTIKSLYSPEWVVVGICGSLEIAKSLAETRARQIDETLKQWSDYALISKTSVVEGHHQFKIEKLPVIS